MQAIAPDVVCIQETKAQEHQLPLEAAAVAHYHSAFHDAVKPGYSGVAIYARRAPDRIVRGLGWPEYDAEARYLQMDFGALSIVSLYVPSGSSGYARQTVKAAFLKLFEGELARMRADGRSYVVAGDFNVAHRDIDVFDPKRCSRISGFFPEDRAWMERVLQQGWVDGFRQADPNPKRYTWWSNFPRAFANNLGWRIDYQLLTPDLRERVRGASIYTERRFSDHAPLVMDYDLDL